MQMVLNLIANPAVQTRMQNNTNCITERISKVDGYTSALQFKQK